MLSYVGEEDTSDDESSDEDDQTCSALTPTASPSTMPRWQARDKERKQTTQGRDGRKARRHHTGILKREMEWWEMQLFFFFKRPPRRCLPTNVPRCEMRVPPLLFLGLSLALLLRIYLWQGPEPCPGARHQALHAPPPPPTLVPPKTTLVPPKSCVDLAPGDGSSCLQQALWDKCHLPFMSRVCDLSCGRCGSDVRGRALRSALLVSARQPTPCAEAGADAWVQRAMQNKAEYALAQQLEGFVWSSAQINAAYDGAWNKLTYLSSVLAERLAQSRGASEEAVRAGGREGSRWVLWADWDVVFTDLGHQLPLEEYEAPGGGRLVRREHDMS